MENPDPSESVLHVDDTDTHLFLSQALAAGLAPAEFAVKLLKENLVPFVESETGIRISRSNKELNYQK